MRVLRGIFLAGWLAANGVAAEAVWARHVIDDSSSGADGVRLADINGDGRPDITTGWEKGGTVRAYVNPGPARTKDKWPAVTVGQAPNVEDAVFADLDGDGAFDVITSCEGETRTHFVHWAPRERSNFLDTSQWRTEPLPATRGKTMWMFCAPANVDGRDGVDLIVGSKGKHPGDAVIGWLKSPANPRQLGAWLWYPLRSAGWVMGIEPVDMDGDGDVDIVCSERFNGPRGGVFWLENPGQADLDTARWKEHSIGLRGDNALFFCLVDLDRDGLQDVCVGSHTTGDESQTALYYLRRLDRTGDHWSSRKIELPAGSAQFKAVSAGDIDSDGEVDLVVSFVRAKNKPALIWLSQEGSPFGGRWSPHVLSGVDGVKHDVVALVDLDGDGDLDAITTEEVTNLGVIWYENPSKPSRPPGT